MNKSVRDVWLPLGTYVSMWCMIVVATQRGILGKNAQEKILFSTILIFMQESMITYRSHSTQLRWSTAKWYWNICSFSLSCHSSINNEAHLISVSIVVTHCIYFQSTLFGVRKVKKVWCMLGCYTPPSSILASHTLNYL